MSYKETGFKVGCFVNFFHPPEKNLPMQKVISMSRFANQYKMCYKRNGLESWLVLLVPVIIL